MPCAAASCAVLANSPRTERTGQRQMGFGFFERDLGIRRIQPHQDLPGTDVLGVIGIDADNRAPRFAE